MNQVCTFRYAVLRGFTAILFVFFFANAAFAQFQVTNYNGAAVVADEIIIRLRTADPAARARAGNALPGAAVSALSSQLPLHLVRLPGPGLAALLQAFSNHPDVLYAEPNYVVTAIKTPNDPFYSTLWGMTRIAAPAAWDLTTGGTSAVIGVVDSGVDYTHPDLAANMWSAPATFTVTVGGAHVTCPAGSHGFNALTLTCDPLDDYDHGTHVSGTIGAKGDNTIGVVGVNWSARIMGLKFLSSAGSGTTSGAVYAIEFARQVKQLFAGTATPVDVRVLSNSWGGSSFSQSLLDEINLANTDNMLFVAAAGNNSSNNDIVPFYPANYSAPNVISVAATHSGDALAGFSNYGATKVHLAAPGQTINSTVRSGGYAYFSGTSMATPHVAGAALLTLSACPSLNTAALKNAILNNVDLLTNLQGYTITGGLLNVDRAVRSCISTTTLVSSANPAAVGSSVTFTATVSSSNNPTGSVAFTDNGSPLSGCSAVALNGTGNAKTAACTTSSLSAGTHSIVASYSGDANDTPTVSSPLSQTMTAAPMTGPVGYWALNETAGNTASDSSGNNNTGTLINGPVWSSAGRVGGALSFDGVNDYVSLGNPASLIPGNAITLAGWVKLNDLSSNRFFVSKYAGPTPTFMRYEVGQGIKCVVGGTGVTAPASIVAGQWYHAGCTYDGATIRVYINGVQVATAAKTGAISDALGIDWAIGAAMAANSTPVGFMNGLLDEVQLYNRALTPAEISQLSNPSVPDTNPPALSNGGPSGTLPAGTAQATLTAATNENATCRYSTVAGTAYSAMTNTFSTTGGTSHSTSVTGLTNGNSYNFFVRCLDMAGNANTTDYPISFSVASAPPPPDITTGLSGYWALNETAGNTASDSSGNNNPGTLINGPVWSSAGRVGGALSFDGVNDYVSLGNPVSLTPGNAMTLAGWINLSDTSATRFIISKYDDHSPNVSTFLRYQNGGSIICSIGGTAVTAPASIVAGQWYHAACTYDGAVINLYVNGVGVATLAKTGVIADEVGADWLIGARVPTNPQAFMKGLLDEVRLYNRALTAADISQLNNPGAPDTNPPVLSNGGPSGTLPTGTTQVTLTVATNENATCRYSTVAGTAYSAMTTFSSTGGTSDSTSVTGLSNGNSYNFFVRCMDTVGNANTTDYPISFSVAPADTNPPVLSNGGPSGTLPLGTTQATLTAATNENATCRYSTVAGTAYSAMTNTFSTTGGTSHSTSVTGLTNGNSYNFFVRCLDAAGNANTTDYTISFSVAADTNPPVLSNGGPSGTLPLGTTQATLTAATNENATCRYSTVAGTAYSAMTNTFSPTGGTSHSTSVTGLTNGNSYNFFVRCLDAAGNANTTDYTISFSVAADTNPPVLSNGGPSGTLPLGTTQATLTAATNENATCRYSTVAGTAYSAMTNTFSTTGGTSHSTSVTGLTNGNSYNFFVRCLDMAGNANTTDYPISFSVASAPLPPDITTGLSGYWALNETAGNTASDSSGNNNVGTLINGPAWSSAGKVGGALSFDGVNDYVSLGNPVSLTPGNAMTLAGWINLSDTSATRFIISKYDDHSPNVSTFLRYQNGGSIICSIGGTAVTAPASIVAGQWYHAACTYDGAVINLYVNGVGVATLAKTGVIADEVGADWLIGARVPTNPQAFMKGLLDEVRLYNRALTAADISQLSNQ